MSLTLAATDLPDVNVWLALAVTLPMLAEKIQRWITEVKARG